MHLTLPKFERVAKLHQFIIQYPDPTLNSIRTINRALRALDQLL